MFQSTPPNSLNTLTGNIENEALALSVSSVKSVGDSLRRLGVDSFDS